MDTEQKTDRRGGARPGAGRKSKDRVKRSFTLRRRTSQALDDAIDAGTRSDFVDESILERISKINLRE
jgi:hypothetical protein